MSSVDSSNADAVRPKWSSSSAVASRPDWLDDKYVEHVGNVDWYDAGKEFRALPWRQRIFHSHQAQTRVWWRDGDYLERCICGAYGSGGGYWRKRL